MIPLYMDGHIPRAITIGLRLRGVDLITAQEDNSSGKSDAELLDSAGRLGRTLFTYDDDLLVEATKRQRDGKEFHGVIYAHHLKLSIGRCIGDLEVLSKHGSIDEVRNQVIFLPL